MPIKLLIIGAGIGQVPLLQKAKRRGIHVTVVSRPGNYPCFSMADDIIYRDIYDRDGIAEEAKKREITAVISDQNDLTNPTVAYVAEKLGLPGNRFSTVMSYCDKILFRAMCEKIGVPVPRNIAVVSETFNADCFNCPLPWIVKPADSQSSIAVKKIEKKEELHQALVLALQSSPTHRAIIEEYFSGHEIVCEGFIHEGKYELLSFADRKYFELGELRIPSQTLFPSMVKEELLTRVLDCERRIATYTSPSFAIVHSEYLINLETEEIRVVESALRGGGVYISSDLIPMCTGIDINDVLLDMAVGAKPDITAIFNQKYHKASGYICFYLPEGTVERIYGAEELKELPYVRQAYIDDIKVGQNTEPLTYKGARKGPILVEGQCRAELEKNIDVIRNTLHIDVRTTEGQLDGIKWE